MGIKNWLKRSRVSTEVVPIDPHAAMMWASQDLPVELVTGAGGQMSILDYGLTVRAPFQTVRATTDPDTGVGLTGLAGDTYAAVAPDDNPRAMVQQYQWLVRTIGQYRLVNPDFEFLYFKRPEWLACTDAKFDLRRPRKVGDDEDLYETLKSNVSPPFEWFNENVNQTKQGATKGAAELCRWVLDHCLEGGVAAWSASVGWVQINGVWWRTITQVSTFGGSQLGLDLKANLGNTQKWYIRNTPQQHRFGFESGYAQGYDSTQYEGNPNWMPVDSNDGHLTGKYRGIVQYMHPDGSRSKYPVPPCASLINTMTSLWMLSKDNLRTLAKRERLVWIWTFDQQAMAALNIPWNDVSVPQSDGTTKVVKGAPTLFREMRQLVVNGRDTNQEIQLPNWIKLEQREPGIDLLKATDTLTTFNDQMGRSAGFFQDDNGAYAKEEAEEFAKGKYQFDRQSVLEPFLNALYKIILDENIRLWHGKNRIDPEDMNPFVFVTPRGKRVLNAKPAPSLAGRHSQKMQLLDARLSGDIESLEITCRLTPNPAVRSKDLDTIGRLAQQGLVAVEVLHEAMGRDPEQMRNMKRREAVRDMVPVDPGMVSLWAATPGVAQRVDVTTVEPNGSSNTDSSETLSRTSPGRPPEGKTDAP